MGDPIEVTELPLEDSLKNANFGTGNNMNHLKRVVKTRYKDGSAKLEFYSQKRQTPGQVIKFSAEDFRRFQQFLFPVIQEFEGLHGVVTGHMSPSINVGLDAVNNPVITLPKEDRSVRVNCQIILDWLQSQAKLPRGMK